MHNLPFHVSDFSTFGHTKDLFNLYDIALVTDEEFEWHLIHPEIDSGTLRGEQIQPRAIHHFQLPRQERRSGAMQIQHPCR